MENPATWGPAEKLVHAVISEWQANHDAVNPVIGLSLERQITMALHDSGMLTDLHYGKQDVYSGFLEGEGILRVKRPETGQTLHFVIHDSKVHGGPWTKRRWARRELRRARMGLS